MYTSFKIKIGALEVGGNAPIRIQSMTNTDTMDTHATVEQCIRIILAGSDLVRMTVRNQKEAENLRNIKNELTKRGFKIPLIADVHFNPKIAEISAGIVDKVRINPGNFAGSDLENKLVSLLQICKRNHTAIRIGVNHGSLSERIMEKYGNTPEGMVESAMEYLRICTKENFFSVVVSIKSSNTRIMIWSNRLLVKAMQHEGMNFPLHLGVTEAGEGEDGRIRSAVGIGTLIGEGIGDTIRISLTEDPEKEIPVARKLVSLFGNIRHEPDHIPDWNQLISVRRKTIRIGNIGNTQVPVVISSTRESAVLSGHPENYITPDYVFTTSQDKIITSPDLHHFPIIIQAESGNPHSLFLAFNANIRSGLKNPVIIRAEYTDSDPEIFRLKVSAELGRYFIDSLADGIWLENLNFKSAENTLLAFNLLQASRARMFKTEYIACPSCGRTLFDIQDTLARVKAATSHLKHLKIAVMGCIVNGPGEMADADYGFVGSAPGKITLFKKKAAVKKNILSENAINEMIQLIKDNNDWIDP